MKEYNRFDIPQVIRQNLPDEQEFIRIMRDCYEERPFKEDDPCNDEDYEFYEEECTDINGWAIDKITNITIEMIEKGRMIERAITVSDFNRFLSDVKTGKNGIGLSWSYSHGKVVEGSEDDRYGVVIQAKVLDPSAINFVGTYCHEQYDIEIDLNPDEEILLEDGGKIQVLSMEVYDKETEKDEEKMFDDLVVNVREFY